MSARDRLSDQVADLLPSDDALREQAYLVARGVRALADVGSAPADPDLVARVVTHLETLGDVGSIAFAVDCPDATASFGYARAGWVIDLYRWVLSQEVPQERRAQILGLLLGYSPDEIGHYCDRGAGRRYMATR